MQRQRMAERLRLHVGVDPAVGIAGQVGDHAVALRAFVQARDRHDREHLVDGPDVGNRLEHREVHEVLVDQTLVEFVQHLAVGFVVRIQLAAHGVRDGVEQVVEQGAVVEAELAVREQRLAFGQIMLGLEIDFQRGAAVDAAHQVAQVLDHQRFAGARVRHGAVRRLFDLGDVDHHHGVVRGHRAAGLGDHARLGQAVFGAGLLQRLHQGLRELLEPVVDRAGAARAGAFVVDAQAAAGIHEADQAAGLAQLDEIAHRLAHAGGDVAQVGDLRAHVEMQQLQAVELAGGAQALDQIQHLARRQPELGLVAAGVLPLAGAQGGQPQAHADARLNAELGRFLQDHVELGRLFDHDGGVEAEALAEQGQMDELAVLVAVADDHAAGLGQRQHRHQLGLGAGLEAELLVAGRGQHASHAVMLVDLDRVDRGVAALVAQVAHGGVERALHGLQAVRQDVAETQQQRQFQAVAGGLLDQLGNRQTRTLRPQRLRADPAGGVHVEIAFRPERQGIQLFGVVDRPGAHGQGSFSGEAYCTPPTRYRIQLRLIFQAPAPEETPCPTPPGSTRISSTPARPSDSASCASWTRCSRRSRRSRSSRPPTSAT